MLLRLSVTLFMSAAEALWSKFGRQSGAANRFDEPGCGLPSPELQQKRCFIEWNKKLALLEILRWILLTAKLLLCSLIRFGLFGSYRLLRQLSLNSETFHSKPAGEATIRCSLGPFIDIGAWRCRGFFSNIRVVLSPGLVFFYGPQKAAVLICPRT